MLQLPSCVEHSCGSDGNPAGTLFWDPWEWGLSLTDKLSIWGKSLPLSAFIGLLRDPGIGGQWMLRAKGGAWIPVQIKSHAVVWSDIQTSMWLVSWKDHFESPILSFGIWCKCLLSKLKFDSLGLLPIMSFDKNRSGFLSSSFSDGVGSLWKLTFWISAECFDYGGNDLLKAHIQGLGYSSLGRIYVFHACSPGSRPSIA